MTTEELEKRKKLLEVERQFSLPGEQFELNIEYFNELGTYIDDTFTDWEKVITVERFLEGTEEKPLKFFAIDGTCKEIK